MHPETSVLRRSAKRPRLPTSCWLFVVPSLAGLACGGGMMDAASAPAPAAAAPPPMAQAPMAAVEGMPPPPAPPPPAPPEQPMIALAEDAPAREFRAGKEEGAAAAEVMWAPVREFPAPSYAGANDGPRTDFRETIFWKPSIQTDERGVAHVDFYLSDAVTSFRATVEGMASGRAGHGEAMIGSKLPVSLAVKLPLEVSSGDRIDLPVTISNTTWRPRRSRSSRRRAARTSMGSRSSAPGPRPARATSRSRSGAAPWPTP
jgi:hypothetical protein